MEIIMRVNECMSRDVQVATPDETLLEAARTMADIDAGFLPVGDGDKLVGIITDRDMAVRAIAQGLGPEARVRQIMSEEVLYCFEDQDGEEVLDNMADMQIRRLPVVDRDKRLVGVVSITDLAEGGDETRAGQTLRDIARPSALHSQVIERERVVS
jgi:CBS domain-containing protein